MGRVLLLAYTLNPNRGSECGLADAWLRLISKHYPVVVVTDQIHESDLKTVDYPNVEFNFIPVPKWTRWLGNVLVYKLFYRMARPKLNSLCAGGDISLLHCITPSGIHSYNDAYRFRRPVLTGPVNGGLPTPKGFGRVFRDRLVKNLFRELMYRCFLKTRGWREYFLQSEKIIISTADVLTILPSAARQRAEIVFDVVVDVRQFTPPVTKSEAAQVRVLYAGTLESKKGVKLLLEAALRCRRQGVTNFSVEIAGTGHQAPSLERWIRKRQLGGVVKLLGLLSRPELIRRYQESDIFCFPSLREPGGYVVLEAMACGLPVITTNYGGPAVSVSDDCGFKITPNGYEAYVRDLASAMIRLIQDRPLRNAMGRAARERVVKKFSSEILEKKILHIYEELKA